MKMAALQAMAEQDLKISIDNLENESARTPSIHNKFMKELIIAKDRFIISEMDLRKLKRNKWLYYTGKASPEIYAENPLDIKIMKSDIKMFIESDKDVIDLEYIISKHKDKINYIDSIIGECNRRSFHINSAIQSLKFKNGEYGG